MNDLQRFLDAQTPVLDTVLEELAAGRKRTHWMWFVFPQLRGLGASATARFYGLDGLVEARAYWAHPVLSDRLVRGVDAVLGVPPPRSAHAIFGSPDDLKFRSCLTLFERVAGDVRFAEALDRFYAGHRDAATLAMLGESS